MVWQKVWILFYEQQVEGGGLGLLWQFNIVQEGFFMWEFYGLVRLKENEGVEIELIFIYCVIREDIILFYE